MTTPSLKYTNGQKDFHIILQEAIQICFHPLEAHSAEDYYSQFYVTDRQA